MALSPIAPGVQGHLRSEVETCPTLMSLYDRLLSIVSALPVARAEELRGHSSTFEFRTQIAESLPTRSGPFLDLAFRRALCGIIDQCEDDDEVLQLAFALVQQLGGEVEMYVQAVDVDPDQRRYWSQGLDFTVGGHRERPRLVAVGGRGLDEGEPESSEPRSGRRSPG